MTDLHARLLITVSLVTSKGEEQLEQFSSKEQVNKPWLTYAMKYFSAVKKKTRDVIDRKILRAYC